MFSSSCRRRDRVDSEPEGESARGRKSSSSQRDASAPGSSKSEPVTRGELWKLPTMALAKAIRERQVSSRDVVEEYLARMKVVNASIHAIVEVVADRALAEAARADEALARGQVLGPLHGVPWSVKDAFDTEGVTTTWGTKGRAGYKPKEDATVVARLRGAGAILIGKSNTPEVCLLPETLNDLFETTNNPYDLKRTPGGSSGGAAAAVASGLVSFDFGSDMAGSLRQPAAYCGVFTIKPSIGLVPTTGHLRFGQEAEFLQVGPLTRTVGDALEILNIVAGPDGRDQLVKESRKISRIDLPKQLRIAFYTDNGIIPASEEVGKAVEAAAHSFEPAATLRDAKPDALKETTELWLKVIGANGGDEIRALLKEAGTKKPNLYVGATLDAFKSFRRKGQKAAAELREELARYRSSLSAFFKEYDLVISPTHSHVAMPHLKVMTTDEGPAGASYAMSYNIAGTPAANIRVATSGEGLPIGVQLAAAQGREDLIFAAAQRLEQTFGGWQAPPAV
jgi:amidase